MSAFTMVLGVAQDGGYPHLGCRSACCDRARSDPAARRMVTCLGVGSRGKAYLLDATPDLILQATRLAEAAGARGGRMRPVDGVFLTHAHMGHYLGLAFLGRESAWSLGVPVWGTGKMIRFLRENAPWDQLIALRNIEPRLLDEVDLPGDVRVTAFPVPHRDEYTDTVGFRIEGPEGRVLYLPDIDSWEEWDRSLAEAVSSVDRAYLDGTFFSDAELPGRDITKIPHPRVEATIRLLGDLPREERAKVRFLHLNHTNPLLAPGAPEVALVEEAGMAVAEEGERFPL